MEIAMAVARDRRNANAPFRRVVRLSVYQEIIHGTL
jgi:hypothetical protein